MKHNKYVFKFDDGIVGVMALCIEDAIILAQAEAIKNGWKYAEYQCINIE